MCANNGIEFQGEAKISVQHGLEGFSGVDVTMRRMMMENEAMTLILKARSL